MEDREVFRKAYRLSLESHGASLGFLPHEPFALGDQRHRAFQSIFAKIADFAKITEGFGRQCLSAAGYRRFLMLVLGLVEAMRVWCRYCLDLGLIAEPV